MPMTRVHVRTFGSVILQDAELEALREDHKQVGGLALEFQ
jgi:hypothetical protein